MNLHADPRLAQLRAWLDEVLDRRDYTLSIASSDASFRRYFRVRVGDDSWIVMDAPPEHEDTRPFVRVAEFLLAHKVQVPQLFARDMRAGFLLLSDLGNTPYLEVLDDQSADSLYRRAIDELISMQIAPTADLDLPRYDDTLLQREMDLFSDWFLGRHLTLDMPDCLPQVYALLLDNAAQQPRVFVHRDYHSRNLMLLPDRTPGVIDFQDAVVGPVSYDLVSLLRDCYIAWPQQRIERLIDYYLSQARDKGVLDEVDRPRFLRWFDLMGLQRHLKVLGIFCRLNYRDGKPRYLDDLPLTLSYVLQVTQRYPELASLDDFLRNNRTIMAIL